MKIMVFSEGNKTDWRITQTHEAVNQAIELIPKHWLVRPVNFFVEVTSKLLCNVPDVAEWLSKMNKAEKKKIAWDHQQTIRVDDPPQKIFVRMADNAATARMFRGQFLREIALRLFEQDHYVLLTASELRTEMKIQAPNGVGLLFGQSFSRFLLERDNFGSCCPGQFRWMVILDQWIREQELSRQ